MAHPISPVLGIISLALSTVARIDLIEAFALVTGYAQNITSSILMIHTDEQRCMPIVFVRAFWTDSSVRRLRILRGRLEELFGVTSRNTFV